MNARISTKLALAALLAAAVPTAASAHDSDRGPGYPAAAPAPWTPAPPPPAWAPPPAYAGERERGERWEHRGHGFGWRARELHRIDEQLRALDAERADFHARFAFRPWALRRYDREFFERRAALEHRREELVRVAWR